MATKPKSYAKKDETGCLLATCRHCLLLKGLDMYRGEIYAYPYTLQVNPGYTNLIHIHSGSNFLGNI